MTIYAASDVVYVGISRDHGGCGDSHSRPVVKGAPAKLWALTCHNGCEDFLRHDALWSSTISEIPETHDEKIQREDQEKRGQREQGDATALALSELAKLGNLPEAISQLAKIMAGQLTAAPADTMDLLCGNGHRNAATGAFCGTCGTSLAKGVPSSRGPALTAPAVGHEDPNPFKELSTAPDLESMTLPELRDMAAGLGVRTTRSREDQIALIRAAQQ